MTKIFDELGAQIVNPVTLSTSFTRKEGQFNEKREIDVRTFSSVCRLKFPIAQHSESTLNQSAFLELIKAVLRQRWTCVCPVSNDCMVVFAQKQGLQ